MPLDVFYTIVQKNSKMTKNSKHRGPALRRFAAVSPFCFGYPAQPDIAS